VQKNDGGSSLKQKENISDQMFLTVMKLNDDRRCHHSFIFQQNKRIPSRKNLGLVSGLSLYISSI
jgi:hypothetical protein